jgi:hypothetical protein
MNTKQTAPIITGIAPAIAVMPSLLFIGGLVALAAWLLSDDDQKNPEKLPKKDTVSRPPITFPPNSGGNSAQNPRIPANSARKATVPPPLPSFSANCVPAEPETPAPLSSVIPALEYTPETPLQAQKKLITREDLATVFRRGESVLTRKAAVAALKVLGFGKSAAYEALAMDGRFAPWLQFAPDGRIAWKSR